MRRSLLSLGLAVASLVALEGTALAQDDEPAPAPSSPASSSSSSSSSMPPTPPPAENKPEEPKDHSVAVLLSPLHLILPVVEITAEFRLHERIGLAAIGGIGSVDPYQFSSTKPPPGVTTGRFTVWELGGQFLAYPVGHFDHGMQLGAEILYVGVAGSAQSRDTSASGTAQGLAVGPLIGYKFTAKVGFSLAIQGGVAYLAMRADAKDSNGNSSSAENSSVSPLLNLNLGWAF